MLPLLVGIQNLKRCRPDFKIDFRGPALDLLTGHPDITKCNGRLIVPQYDGKTACNKGLNFVQTYHADLEKKLGFSIPVVDTSPRLYLSPEEDTPPPYLPRDYALVVSGGKKDLTAKWWGWWNYQSLVNQVPEIPWVQIGHQDKSGWHVHPRLNGCIDMVGRSTMRELMRIIRFAKVLVCGVTLPMWIAAAFHTKAVIITGGREPAFFIAQPNQIYHDSSKELACGRNGKGCWLSRTQRMYDGFFLDLSTCHNTYLWPQGLDVRTPKCMEWISPSEVASSVRRQLSGKVGLQLLP